MQIIKSFESSVEEIKDNIFLLKNASYSFFDGNVEHDRSGMIYHLINN